MVICAAEIKEGLDMLREAEIRLSCAGGALGEAALGREGTRAGCRQSAPLGLRLYGAGNGYRALQTGSVPGRRREL